MQTLHRLSARITGQWTTAAAILSTVAFLYYLLILHTQPFPLVTPDGEYYLKLSGDILEGALPETLVRTPLYPLFLAPFLALGSLKLAVYTQMLISCASLYLVFLLAARITGSRGAALLLALLSIFDFNFYQFQYLILTETLAGFLLLLFLYLQLNALSGTASRMQLACNLLCGLALVFLRPVFILLPTALYLLILIPHRTQENDRRRITRFAVLAILLNILCITAWCSLNQYRYREFTFSSVSGINSLGKALTKGCIAEFPLKENDSPSIKEAVRFVRKVRPISPYDVLNHLEALGIRTRPDSLASVFMQGKRTEMFLSDLRSFGHVLTAESHPYISVPAIRSHSILLYASFLALDKIKSICSFCIFVSILVVLLQFRQGGARLAMPLALVAITIFYTVGMSVLFSYSEFSRLRSPVELPVNLLLLATVMQVTRLITLFRK